MQTLPVSPELQQEADILACLAPRTRPFYRSPEAVIVHDDFLKANAIREGTVDLIVTSPPYNVDISYGRHNDRLSHDEYVKFTRRWLAKCYGLAKDDGRFCLNIPLDKNKGGQQSVYADITWAAKDVGWKYQSTIVWNEQNISRRTAWGSWKSASAPFIIAPVEMIVVFYKHSWKKLPGLRSSDLTRDEFLEWTNGVWTFSGEKKTRVGHPAPFPMELPRRCIKLFSFIGDVVFDPFLGSGTTLLACLETHRKGIGLDIDKSYCELAQNRIIEFHKDPLQQVSESSLDTVSIEKFLSSNELVLHPPSIKQIALVLAKACGLRYAGRTKTGKLVHMPSSNQVELWIAKKLRRSAVPSRGADLPTNEQIAAVLSRILKLPAESQQHLQAPQVSADQIRSWIERHA